MSLEGRGGERGRGGVRFPEKLMSNVLIALTRKIKSSLLSSLLWTMIVLVLVLMTMVVLCNNWEISRGVYTISARKFINTVDVNDLWRVKSNYFLFFL